jgi:hypothetical protein
MQSASDCIGWRFAATAVAVSLRVAWQGGFECEPERRELRVSPPGVARPFAPRVSGLGAANERAPSGQPDCTAGTAEIERLTAALAECAASKEPAGDSSSWATGSVFSVQEANSRPPPAQLRPAYNKQLDMDEAAHVTGVTLPVCSNQLSGNNWKAFSSVIHVLQVVNATYTLSSGSVLQWYRDCDIGDDLDFSVDFDWFMAHMSR